MSTYSRCCTALKNSSIYLRTIEHYRQNEAILSESTNLLAKTIGSTVWSAGLNWIGSRIDHSWKPKDDFPSLFATIGWGLGLCAGLGEPLVKYAFKPLNMFYSLNTAVGEQILTSLGHDNPHSDFHITYTYVDNFLFCRYNARGELKEPQPNPSLIFGALGGGIIGNTVAKNSFTNIAQFAVPFISPSTAAMLASPIGAIMGIVLAKPAAKILATTAGLFAIALTPGCRKLYECKPKEKPRQPSLVEQLISNNPAPLNDITYSS